MSGEGRSGRYRGPIFANPEIGGTAFQLSSIDGMVKVVPSDIKQGIMTERQLAKAVLKVEEEAFYDSVGKRGFDATDAPCHRIKLA